MIDKENIETIFNILEKHNQNPKTELDYSTPFELFVAVVLSAQATDKSVNKVTKELFQIANTPEDFIKLGECGLKQYIKSIGLFNSKAKNIIAACEILVEKFNGILPDKRELLEMLPGVGRKSANVILNAAFNQPTIAVDRHVLRVANRIGIVSSDSTIEVENVLEKIVLEKHKKYVSNWLVLHGRYICTARAPKCKQCMLSGLCEFYANL